MKTRTAKKLQVRDGSRPYTPLTPPTRIRYLPRVHHDVPATELRERVRIWLRSAMDAEALSYGEVGDILGVSEHTVFSWVRQSGTAMPCSGLVRFLAIELGVDPPEGFVRREWRAWRQKWLASIEARDGKIEPADPPRYCPPWAPEDTGSIFHRRPLACITAKSKG